MSSEANQDRSTEVAVVGGGPGGYAAAFRAADLGKQVTMIDPGPDPGGVCLFRGCIPTKALLHAAGLIRDAREAEEMGLRFQTPEVDVERLRSWKDEVVKKLTGGLGRLARGRKVEHVRGTARFVDANTLEITGAGDQGGDEERAGGRLAFEQAIVATGGRPATLQGLSFDSPRILDSAQALELEEVPGSLLVVGGGYIGLELGSVYAMLGSRVTVVEMMPGLMPGADRDLVSVFEKRNRDLFEAIRTGTTAQLEETGEGIRAVFQSREKGGEDSQVFDKVLLTVGRIPNTEDLGLENTAVELDERGFIRVDEQRRTREQGTFAIGDVTGGPLLAHKATHEGIVAAEVVAGRRAAFEPHAIPAVEYTDPEIAWTGLTQTQAEEEGRNVEISVFPWAASGRAATLGRTDGLTKLVIDPETERVLGVGIVGMSAGELIGEGTLAVEMAALADDLALTIHPHPTLSETLMEAAEAYHGLSTHIHKPKRKKGK